MLLACICSVHFDEGAFIIPLKHQLVQYKSKSLRTLKPDAIPTINLPNKVSRDSEAIKCRIARSVRRQQKKIVQSLIAKAESDESKGEEGQFAELTENAKLQKGNDQSEQQISNDGNIQMGMFFVFLPIL